MKSKFQGEEYTHKAIVDACIGCGRVVNGENVCRAYLNPSMWWRHGSCPAATHISVILAENTQGKQRAGQQKQKKRG